MKCRHLQLSRSGTHCWYTKTTLIILVTVEKIHFLTYRTIHVLQSEQYFLYSIEFLLTQVNRHIVKCKYTARTICVSSPMHSRHLLLPLSQFHLISLFLSMHSSIPYTCRWYDLVQVIMWMDTPTGLTSPLRRAFTLTYTEQVIIHARLHPPNFKAYSHILNPIHTIIQFRLYC